jgi:hypothetical protein
MRLIHKLSKGPDFRTYPLANHLTQSWLGGNVCRANQLSQSERELGPQIMRSYYHQQLDWQAAVINLMNQVAFRTKNNRGGLVSKTRTKIEEDLNVDGLAMHQMNRLLRFDSHLFQRPCHPASCWPDHNPAWSELDRRFSDVSLPKL